MEKNSTCLYQARQLRNAPIQVKPIHPRTRRIGDGTAGFYNYVYYTVAGFTEHDTFRSNQVREGDLTRERALELTKDENKPGYQNIRWYLDTLGMDYYDMIKLINSIPKLPRFIQ